MVLAVQSCIQAALAAAAPLAAAQADAGPQFAALAAAFAAGLVLALAGVLAVARLRREPSGEDQAASAEAARRHTEELAQSENRFRIIFERSPVGLLLFDNKGKVIKVNDHLAGIFGASKDDYTGMELLTAMPESWAKESVRQTLATGKAEFEGEYTSIISGKKLFLRLYNRKLADDLYICIMEDATFRKRSEEALIESEARFRTISLNTSDMVYSCLHDLFLGYRIDWVSGASERITGYAPEELKALGCWRALVIEEDLRRFDNHVLGLAPGQSAECELRIRRKDGQVIWARSASHCAPSADGKFPKRTYGSLSDISTRKRMEASLVRAKELAEAANIAKSEFLATVSHEIGTPLNAVLGMLQLTMMTSLSGEQQRYLNSALSAGRGLKRILGDILDLSRIESGKLEVVERPFALNELISPLLDAFALEARNKGLALTRHMAADLPELVSGDAGRIRQILYNLIGNAIKYTERGEVRLDVYTLPGGQREGKKRIHFVVSDTGLGIEDSKLASVFEPFIQADASITRRFGGAGLGLGIVQRLVHLMRGGLSVYSEEGEGSEFHVWLDLRPEQAPAPRETGSTPLDDIKPSLAAGKRILVAEDEPINLMAVSNFLRRAGLNVSEAKNGAAVLTALENADFDLILMDIQMPVMGGLEAARAIRGEPRFAAKSRVPIIALTAHAMSGDEKVFLEAGMNSVVAKPYDMHDLLRAVEKTLAATAGEGQRP